MQITQEEVRASFAYTDTGGLVHRGGRFAGAPVGSVSTGGKHRPDKKYLHTKIRGRHYAVHRLVWLYHYSDLPEQIDHVNRDSLDNRIENLRPASATENMSNRKLFKNSTSRCKGVSWHKRRNAWFVYVDANKKRRTLGYFDDLEFAELVATEARDKYHGAFANHA